MTLMYSYKQTILVYRLNPIIYYLVIIRVYILYNQPFGINNKEE